MNKKLLKNQDSRKEAMSPNSQPSKKQKRKVENPIRIPPSTWICRNSACRALLTIADTFCKRCSCCICHLFDDNKDPSLWLECSSGSPAGSCGLSCHIECAFQQRKIGVVDLGPLMQLDGSYCCASCGRISGILGFWKKQLTIARVSRRVDSLCYRIHLSFRLFDGTSRFQDLHEFVKAAKTILETEVGPLGGVSAKMARGIVGRLSVAQEVRLLCDAAIQKADEVSATLSSARLDGKGGSIPAACKFIFEEITASSVVLVLLESSIASSSDINGFKLWYSKATEEIHTKDAFSVYPRSQRRMLISNLEPCTEYWFRVVSFTKTGDLSHSEAKCFTESVEIPHNNPADAMVPRNEGTSGAQEVESDSGLEVRDLGKVLQLTWVDDTAGPDSSQHGQIVNLDTTKADGLPSSSLHGLDLNIAPDLNEDIVPLNDSSRDEAVAQHGSRGGSENWVQHGPNVEVPLPAVDSQAGVSRKRPASTEAHDCDGALINISAHKGGLSDLDEIYEYCVRTIRSLECGGHIEEDFRLQLLTWFSLRSTDKEKKVVYTYIQTFREDLESLAGQLKDTFSDVVKRK